MTSRARLTSRSIRILGVLFAVATMLACEGNGEGDALDTGNPSACTGVTIDRFKEIVIVDDAVVDDARSRNDANGPWSFRRQMEAATPPTRDSTGNVIMDADGRPVRDTASFVASWLTTWKSSNRVNLFPVPSRRLVETTALCNWLRATPENKCDAACNVCEQRAFKLEKLPFRLIAIVNRPDIAPEDLAVAGEGRFVYALTSGPGDDPASPPLDMTIIFEYRQPLNGRTRKQNAESWHALGRHAAFDETYKAALELVTQSFSGENLEADRPLGSSLSQLRTNEREFEWQWDLREFRLTSAGFVLNTTANTPDASLNGTEELAKFIRANREPILKKKHVLPSRLAGGAAQILTLWSAPGVDSQALKAFNDETCNGCHQNRFLDFNFHISPHRRGVEKLSTFMHNPADLQNDDIALRERLMRDRLCGEQ